MIQVRSLELVGPSGFTIDWGSTTALPASFQSGTPLTLDVALYTPAASGDYSVVLVVTCLATG